MSDTLLYQHAQNYLTTLCNDIDSRRVGSSGNRQAAYFINQIFQSFGWQTELPQFQAMDWQVNKARLTVGGEAFKIFPSPYSLGCNVNAELVLASTLRELQHLDASGTVLLLHGDIASEQLMPKNFVFYNPDHHQQIITELERQQPAAIVTVTGRSASPGGAHYPTPLIEDGDFDIPSVYMTEEEGKRLQYFAGQTASLFSDAKRIPETGRNVIARQQKNPQNRIVITAHFDAKMGTPGAIDNATGVIVLLLLAELLQDDPAAAAVELVAFNGEDYYAVPGQMNYIAANDNQFESIRLNINIDGAGYYQGESSFSLFGLPEPMENALQEMFGQFPGATPGVPWPQGDHSIFVQYGRPAIAVSSKWFIDHLDTQQITHTPADHPGIVDSHKLVEIARAIVFLLKKL